MKNKLVIFLRAPQTGGAKSRLAQKLGTRAAIDIYKTLLELLLTSLAPIEPVELCFTPDNAAAESLPWLQPGWTLAPQGEGDLGQRLNRAVEQSFKAQHQHVAIIGSDCPLVTVADIESAWKSLQNHDVVIGPARDGGYWLIGLNARHPELFENIPWSTSAVLQTTLDRVRGAGLKFECLRTLVDIDTPEDWEEYSRAQAQ